MLLEFGQGKEPLQVHSACLKLASPVLADMLEAQGAARPYRLDVSADDRVGWEHVLQIISPHLPPPPPLTLVGCNPFWGGGERKPSKPGHLCTRRKQGFKHAEPLCKKAHPAIRAFIACCPARWE